MCRENSFSPVLVPKGRVSSAMAPGLGLAGGGRQAELWFLQGRMVKRPFVAPLQHPGAISTFCLCDCFGLLCGLLEILCARPAAH